MKIRALALAVGLALASLNSVRATIYSDATGDTFFGGILDIVQVEVTNSASDIFFTISLSASIANPNDWGNYMVGIDSVPGGDSSTPVGNPWSRPISMSSGMDFWLGSWVNGGGGRQLWQYSGSWSQINQTGVSIGAQSVTFSASLANLGLNIGDTFNFDVYASGADGDPGAVDSLSNPNMTINDWNVPYQNGPVSSYTIVAEPTAFALLGLGGLILLQRFVRRRS